MIGGEAGIGKTSLVRHFGRGVIRAIPLLNGSCDPLTTPALGPVLDSDGNLAHGVGGADQLPRNVLALAAVTLLWRHGDDVHRSITRHAAT